MFKEKYQQDNEKISADPAIKKYVKSKLKGEATPPRRKVPVTAFIAAALSICVAVGVIFVANGPKDPEYEKRESGLVTNLSYDSIYASIKTKSPGPIELLTDGVFGGFMDMARGDATLWIDDAEEIKAENATGTNDSNSSSTNNQVQGVDEADIVKNDGKYIYTLSGSALNIVEAGDGKPKPISNLVIAEENEWTSDFYVGKNRVAVIVVSNVETKLKIYDTTDKASPKKLAEVGQSGYVISSRMVGDTVYLLSNYSVYGDIKKDKPETFVPCVGAKPMEPTNISIIDGYENPVYLVISAIDLASAKSTSAESVLGGAENVYCNTEHLYYTFTKRDEKQEGIKRIHLNTTTIVKMKLDPKDITLVADGVVDGTPLNQFSMDEYEGNLRIVTTLDKTVVKDRGALNSNVTDDSIASVEYTKSNNLFVLDEKLNVIGSLTELAKNERVYSVRFDGEIGYFVTFRQVDPLFTVDLSNPKAPRILSELKIPGFSEYLHPFDEGLLFGFGKSATENGLVTGLKLSMFDVSNPADVTENDVTPIDAVWSEASNNHKAIMVDGTKNIIAFAAANDYGKYHVYIYGYTPEKGFYERAEIDIGGGYWDASARFMWIGDHFYIITKSEIYAYSMDIFAPTGSLELPQN